MIHHTRGVYNSGNFLDNGVNSQYLASHIWYNLNMRPGRAFFVDGVCLNKGYISDERCKEEAEKIKGKVMTKDTAPYI